MEKTNRVKQASVLLLITLMLMSSGLVVASTPMNSDSTTMTRFSKSSNGGAPNLTVESLKGGRGISAILTNTGNASATNITWSIVISGKRIFHGAQSTGTIANLAPGNTSKIHTTSLLLGLGKITINATATCTEGATYTELGTGALLLIFAIGVREALP
jgi:hypothetical protein